MRSAQHERARYGWLTPSKMAEEIGLDADTVREFIKAGKLEAYDFGTGERHEYRVPPEAWTRFKESRRVQPARATG